ncbi:hypothetical protein KC332_g8679 [Hortaea werneckii]|nr:hypothetical protein KC358_g8639 [Hortaea werneckii]KAI6828658.1 hypothetical protein KC350_g8023 [Hortaea werneckii]KAI6925757.1 hypothetical protein KC348_g8902 [Hortaea werneckii]KAI6934192.1 hypothetical protein KC341_g7786 [Hortaea werneckii]KAI6951977.1 hypothetical protein KC321_g17825 [Hortaea werneckii]
MLTFVCEMLIHGWLPQLKVAASLLSPIFRLPLGRHLNMAAPQAEEVQKRLTRPPGVQNPERPSALASRRQQSPRPVETVVAKAKIQTQSDGSDNGGRGATAEAVVVESKARPDQSGDGLVKSMDDGDHVRVAG